jgi:membrane-associated phospholipid phosphatase
MNGCSFIQRLRKSLAAALLSGLLLGAPAAPTPVWADSTSRKVGKFLSGIGNSIFLGVGVGLPLLEDGKGGTRHTLRTLDALTTSTLIAEGLKRLIREKRPDSSDHRSFPSGHATAVLAVAITETAIHPKQALLWYGGATLISASRVTLHRHYLHDVVAGAALGYLTARGELSQRRGLILAPVIEPTPRRGWILSPAIEPAQRGVGLLLTKSF